MLTFNAFAALDSDNGVVREWRYTGRAFMVSPAGAPANYGYLPQMTVRSVGFGLIPVEATVQVSQRRENGYPVAAGAVVRGRDYYDATRPGGFSLQVGDGTVVDDAFNVQIVGVRVDGVDLSLTGDCRTVTPAPVHLVGPGYRIPDPYRTVPGQLWPQEWFRTQDPSTFYHPLMGGQLDGTMTIPPFTGCTTASGDDLSALMTLSVSGPGNPISARTGWPCARTIAGAGWPLAPGQSTPKSTIADGWKPTGRPTEGCNGTRPFDYPERADH
jgi:hypothetical protein